LISVDTLRSDRLPAYGYQGVQTPAIDALRGDGILFERAYTHVPLTLPAHVSLLTGALPSTHGVRDNLGYSVDAAKAPLLQQGLKAAGYATGAGVSAFVLRRATGFDVGFEFYDDGIDIGPDPAGPGIQSVQRSGSDTFDAVRPWLRSVADRPFFLFFHIFEPHTPYEPPAEFAAKYESSYDGEVAAADAVVGRLLEELRDLDVYERALIVFLSDHGEGLGDHGESEHGVFLYRSTLQVPLIIKLPRGERAGEMVTEAVQLIDVRPTLVEALGLETGERLEGASLLARDRLELADRPIFAETLYPRLHFGWSDLAALVLGRHHYIDAPQPELYDLLADPDELANLFGSEGELEAELATLLTAYDRQAEAPQPTDPETRRRLEALGYVGEVTVADGAMLPDPKSRVGVLAEIREAHRLFADGDLRSAVTAFQMIVDKEPGIEDAWDYLALARLGLDEPYAAAATYRSALEKVPHSQRLSLRGAVLFYRVGHLEEASVHAKKAVSYDPAAAHTLLAQIAFDRGDLDVAEAEARAALSVPGNRRPDARLIMADILIARGQPRRAADLLSQALEEGIDDEPMISKLAMTYLRIGQPDMAAEILTGFEDSDDPGILLATGKVAMTRQRWAEARAWVERALAVAPNDPAVKLNLGLIAMAEGSLGEAATLLEEAVAGNPSSFDGWNALGSVHAQRGDPGLAIVAWERAHEIDPRVLDVVFNLGVACAQAGRSSRAIAFLEEYVARAEPGPRSEHARTMLRQLQARSSMGG
jgi:arylsulfatase A-like enzyme/Tfp pilus assembly protein PilF